MNSVIAFSVTVASTGVAQQLPSNAVNNSITMHAPTANTGTIVTVGNSSAVTATTGFIVEKSAYASLSIPGANTNSLWIVGTSGDTFNVIGS